ncbi:MAG: hypothetical protein U0174_09210 [Polyangiaceae bacterium]
MLFASSCADFGDIYLRTHFAVDRNVRIYSAERNGMRSDTRFIPASPAPAREATALWLILDGTAQISFGSETMRFSAPALIQMPESWMEGADGSRRVRLETGGEYHRALRILLRTNASFEVLAMDASVLTAAAAYHHAVLGPGAVANANSAKPAKELLRALRASGLLPAGIDPEEIVEEEDAPLTRSWKALQERYAAFDVSPSLKLMAASCGLSLRHTARLIAEIFRDFLMPVGGFREATITLRLCFASMLLSSSALSVAEVAALVGYGHPESLTNAFKRANLPPPQRVRSGYTEEAKHLSAPPRTTAESTPDSFTADAI